MAGSLRANENTESVVAPMGTALTDPQADLLQRHAKTVFLLYDSDAPGQRASFRAADVLLARGMTVRLVTLPDGEDPDTYVAKHGREAMEKLLGAAMDVFDRKVQLLERGGWFADLQRKRRALDALLPTIRLAADSITRDLYIARASEAAGVDRTVLERELAIAAPGASRAAKARSADAPAPTHAAGDEAPERRRSGPYRSDVPGHAAELALVRVMLLHPGLADGIAQSVDRLEAEEGAHPELAAATGAESGILRDAVYRAIYEAVVSRGAGVSDEALAESLDETALDVVSGIKAEPGAVVDAGRTVDGALRMLKERAMQERLGEIDRMTPLAEGTEKDSLLRQKDALRRELAALGSRGWKSVRRPLE